MNPARPARRRNDAMILPPVDSASGGVRGGPWHVRDVRVPLLAYWRRDDRCPTGRHLWDVLVVHSSDGVAFVADDDVERRRFRMRLTCVRCGLVDDVRGIREEDCQYRSTHVDPVPLRSGRLLAQQVDDGGRGDLSTWAVHDDPAAPAVGYISWGRGPRGRRYFSGRLHQWPDGVAVNGPNPAACLAKLANAPAGGPAVDAPAVLARPATTGSTVQHRPRR